MYYIDNNDIKYCTEECTEEYEYLIPDETR